MQFKRLILSIYMQYDRFILNIFGKFKSFPLETGRRKERFPSGLQAKSFPHDGSILRDLVGRSSLRSFLFRNCLMQKENLQSDNLN